MRGKRWQGLVDFGCGWCGRLFGFLSTSRHERLVAGHAEDALGSACIAQVLDLPLAIPAAEAVGAKGLVAGQDGEVFYLVPAVVAAVGAVVADQGAVAEQQQVGVRVEQGAARVAAEAVDVPSVSRCAMSVQCASSETRSSAVQCSAV
jgi:hypothetical protein